MAAYNIYIHRKNTVLVLEKNKFFMMLNLSIDLSQNQRIFDCTLYKSPQKNQIQCNFSVA